MELEKPEARDMTMANWTRTLKKQRRWAAEMRRDGWVCQEPANADKNPPLHMVMPVPEVVDTTQVHPL